jgi:phosphoglycolate phosphatase
VRRIVLFDLDGTLSDPLPGILSSYAAAFAELGLGPPPVVPPADLVGPPLADVLPTLGVPQHRVAEAVAAYRRHYKATGFAENVLYPGIAAALDALADRGITLGVATSKNEGAARLVLEHHGLSGRFVAVAGASDDDTIRHKHQVVHLALERLGRTPGDHAVLVGDRRHDGEGAARIGIACVGVTWGYGTVDELHRAGCAAVIDHPGRLPGVIDQLLRSEPSLSDPAGPR